MSSTSSSEVDAKVQKSLEDTAFAPSNIKNLSGGSVNFIHRVELAKPLDDGTTEVLLKHGENWMATKPEFELAMLRCRIEAESLTRLSGCSTFGSGDSTATHRFTVQTPKFFHFDEDNANQIQQAVPNGINLKDYVLKHYNAPTSESLQPQCRQIGEALGRWLKGFGEWGAKQTEHRQLVAKNTFAQDVKHMINFLFLYDRIKDFPAILDDVKDDLAQIEKEALEERKDESQHQIIHGDFWTGNIILPDAPFEEGKEVPMFVIDWECTQLALPSTDVGQMIGEMYALWRYKSITAGLWMMEGFVAAYGDISEEFALRTALMTGTHLLCTTTQFPGWGPPEKVEEVARLGRDIILHAWKKDRAWLKKTELACLFKSGAQ